MKRSKPSTAAVSDIPSEEVVDASDEPRYRAPALEKGLDILELIAATRGPMTLAEIVRQLDRSSGELFRMILVLEQRGYLTRSGNGEGYRLTDKLFALGMSQPQVKGLVELALPRMRELSETSGQSCHLVMHSQGQIVVVARMESSEEMGFSVRVGYRRSMHSTVSGAVLFAHQAPTTQQRWRSYFEVDASEAELDQFNRRVSKATRQGFVIAPSNVVEGVTDLSAPILRGDVAAAALTIPYVRSSSQRHDIDDCVEMLKTAVTDLSAQLLVVDARV